ncbi:MAG: hypothetical protein N2378_13515, partial [Chloroflexaceae bacterium]|nr:hypothetical protein [Chloroflexaceae bacterium]
AYTARSEQVPGEFVTRGFSAYLQKNGDLSSLLATVRELLARPLPAHAASVPEKPSETTSSVAPDPAVDPDLQEKEVGGNAHLS